MEYFLRGRILIYDYSILCTNAIISTNKLRGDAVNDTIRKFKLHYTSIPLAIQGKLEYMYLNSIRSQIMFI